MGLEEEDANESAQKTRDRDGTNSVCRPTSKNKSSPLSLEYLSSRNSELEKKQQRQQVGESWPAANNFRIHWHTNAARVFVAGSLVAATAAFTRRYHSRRWPNQRIHSCGRPFSIQFNSIRINSRTRTGRHMHTHTS